VRRIERGYDAIVWGVPPQQAGAIERPIGRHPRDRKRMAVVEGGKRALTHYRLVAAAGTLGARLQIALATGRTHQIRVHLSAIGLGIVGDPVYRPRRRPAIGPELEPFLADFGRIALHAWLLGFEHPITSERLRFERPAPAAFDRLFELLSRQARDSSSVNSKSVNHSAGKLRA
jgi:23S rRNA pseudouridine1911/1915/1917 synthase